MKTPESEKLSGVEFGAAGARPCWDVWRWKCPNSESTQQNRADKHKDGEHCQHIEPQG
jgi:hypothetical protein